MPKRLVLGFSSCFCYGFSEVGSAGLGPRFSLGYGIFISSIFVGGCLKNPAEPLPEAAPELNTDLASPPPNAKLGLSYLGFGAEIELPKLDLRSGLAPNRFTCSF